MFRSEAVPPCRKAPSKVRANLPSAADRQGLAIENRDLDGGPIGQPRFVPPPAAHKADPVRALPPGGIRALFP